MLIPIENFHYVDDLGRFVNVEVSERPSPVGPVESTVQYDGGPSLRLQPSVLSNLSKDEKKKRVEQNLLHDLLIASGYSSFNLISKDSTSPTGFKENPDITVVLQEGIVHIEVAEAKETPSARFEGMINFVNKGLMQAHVSDHDFKTAIRGSQFALRASPLMDVVNNLQIPSTAAIYDSIGILTELLDFFKNEPKASYEEVTYQRFSSKYPLLKELNAAYTHRNKPGDDLYPYICSDANCFAPETLAARIEPLIVLKQNKSGNYKGSPLWLALSFTDIQGIGQVSLAELENVGFNFAPFDKLIIGDGLVTLTYSVLEESIQHIKHH